MQVSPETYELLKLAKTAYSDTDKTFNVATYPLSKLWRFTSDTYTGNAGTLPTDDEIGAALLHADLDALTLLTDNRVMKTDKDLQLSFGAIAKGFAGDAAIENVIKDGQSGILNVGGTIFTVGSGEYKIGISSPRDTAADYLQNLPCRAERSYARRAITKGIITPAASVIATSSGATDTPSITA